MEVDMNKSTHRVSVLARPLAEDFDMRELAALVHPASWPRDLRTWLLILIAAALLLASLVGLQHVSTALGQTGAPAPGPLEEDRSTREEGEGRIQQLGHRAYGGNARHLQLPVRF
jgi:hypothetical protein